jgi:hypothetical protein
MKKHLDIKSGFVRIKNRLELNWSIYEWALPLHIDFSSQYVMFIRVLCISLVIKFNREEK